MIALGFFGVRNKLLHLNHSQISPRIDKTGSNKRETQNVLNWFYEIMLQTAQLWVEGDRGRQTQRDWRDQGAENYPGRWVYISQHSSFLWERKLIMFSVF